MKFVNPSAEAEPELFKIHKTIGDYYWSKEDAESPFAKFVDIDVELSYATKMDSLIPVLKYINGYACCVDLSYDVPGKVWDCAIRGGGDDGLEHEAIVRVTKNSPELALSSALCEFLEQRND